MTISRALGLIVVTVHGPLTAASSRQLRHILWDLDQQGNRKVIIDLRDMTVSDGADLELFVDASQRARQRDGHLTLSGPRGATAAALTHAGLSAVLDIQPSASHRAPPSR